LLPDPDISSLSLVEPETVAYNNAVASDCTAPWTAADKDLLSIKECLNRTLLPDDFEPPSDSREEYVNLTYKFVEENYTGTKPIHHLALLVSIIVASAIIPKIFPPQKLRNLFLSADSHAKVRAIYDDMDWVERNKKGMTDKSIFISMITTFIIAIYEPKSPLMKHMLSSKTRGLGNAWTDKYCAPLSFLSLPFPSLPFPSSSLVVDLSILSTAVKGISFTLLVRLGIVWGKGVGAYDKGIFGQSWGCHDDSYIFRMHSTLCSKLASDDPFAPYDSLCFLLGEKNAYFFCKRKKSFTCRPSSFAISGDRSQDADKDLDVYDFCDVAQ
jgi:hypothetical protein